ncbi:DUF2059 domain-containing protein [bacterium]
MRKLIMFSVLSLLLSVPFMNVLHAQEKTTDDLIEELLDTMKMEQTFDEIKVAMSQQMKIQIPIMISQVLQSDEELDPEDIDKLMEDIPEFTEDIFGGIMDALDSKTVIDQIYIPLYKKYFDSEDITALIEFYKTPTGQKMIDVTPALAAESMQLTMDLFGTKMMDNVNKATKELKDKYQK